MHLNPYPWRIAAILTLLSLLLSAGSVSAQDPATVLFEPEHPAVEADEEIEVDVEVRDAEALFGVEITLKFDPEAVQVVDADPEADGVQVELGGLLEAEEVETNEVDNEEGEIRVAYGQQTPTEPADGDGVLLTLTLEGAGGGDAGLEFETVVLLREDGSEQEVTWEGMETPTPTATEQETPEETETAEATETEEPEPTPTEEETPEPETPTETATLEPTDEPTEEPTPTVTELATETPPTLTPTATATASETADDEDDDDDGIPGWVWGGIVAGVAWTDDDAGGVPAWTWLAVAAAIALAAVAVFLGYRYWSQRE
jgi:hypothetical protein